MEKPLQSGTRDNRSPSGASTERLDLCGDWSLYHFSEGTQPVSHPADLHSLGLQPIPAHVPGNVELDVQASGALSDPFYAANIRQLRALEGHDWWYTRSFDLPPAASSQQWDMVFAGLDTLATIWINGVEVGRAANMLIEHRFDVTAALHFGQSNEIAVRLRSATNHARQFHYEGVALSSDHREEGLFIRKAPHVWGWDIMPRAVSAGIWRPVWLAPHPPNAIEHVYYWTSASAPKAPCSASTSSSVARQKTSTVSVYTSSGIGADHSFEFEWPAEFVADRCEIPVPDAHLWWPKGYGRPYLYTVTAQLRRHGETLAERVDRLGIRRLELERSDEAGPSWSPGPAADGIARIDEPSDPQHRFRFVVNGVPVMVKGANWVPLDAFHSRDAQRVDAALNLFDDLGCNMVRCWGGNVYEDDHFFDLCDEKGLLVWQDFCFACGIYPQDDVFLEQVRQEAQSVTERLRNHPALALWCGDNEIDMMYAHNSIPPQSNRLTREVIPQVLQRFDPYRAYVPSSPYLPPTMASNPDALYTCPEQHLWGPRGYFKSSFYTQHSAHFIGEIGYHGCPNVSSLRRFLSPSSLWPWEGNDEWQVHSVYHWQHNAIERDRIALMADQVRELFGHIPRDLKTFAVASQITQAEAKKFFIESTRLRKWRTSGILWWNVIDGWPQFSDAIVDYYFGKKLAYHYIRRVQWPVCVIIGEPGPGKYLPVVVSNDTQEQADGRYQIEDGDTGAVLAGGAFSIPAHQNWQVARLRTYASDRKLYLITWDLNGVAYGNHYVAGSSPLSLEHYQAWLPRIAALERPFDAAHIAE